MVNQFSHGFEDRHFKSSSSQSPHLPSALIWFRGNESLANRTDATASLILDRGKNCLNISPRTSGVYKTDKDIRGFFYARTSAIEKKIKSTLVIINQLIGNIRTSMNHQTFSFSDKLEKIKKKIDEDPEFYNTLPLKLKNKKELALAAVTKKSDLYIYLPEDVKLDPIIALAAVGKDSLMYLFAPKMIQSNTEIALAAIRGNSTMYNYYPDNLKTDEFALKALEVNGAVYPLLPDKLQTEKTVLDTIKKNPIIYAGLPKKLQLQSAVIHAAFSAFPELYNGISVELKENKEVALGYIRASMMKVDISLESIHKNIPEKLCYDEDVILSLFADLNSLSEKSDVREYLYNKVIPDSLKNDLHSICRIASQNPYFYKKLPKDVQDNIIALLGVQEIDDSIANLMHFL